MNKVWKSGSAGLLLTAMLVVSACSSNGNEAGSASPSASPSTPSASETGSAAPSAAPLKGKINLVMWHQPTIDAVNAEIENYKKLHPEVDIEIIFSAFDQYYTTIQTQLIGGGAPVGIGVSPETTQMLAKYLEPLTPYFEEENPYTKQPWKQDYVPNAFEIGKSGTNDVWMVGVAGAVNTGVWYNKKMLDEAGVAVPTTWEELMAAQKTIKDSGQIAWSEQLVANFKGDWYNWQLNYGFNLDDWMKLDTLVPDGRVSQMEVVRGIKKGEIDLKSEKVKAMFAEWKKWVEAGWPENFSSDWGWYDAFVSGKAAFFLGGSWDTPGFVQNIKDFEFGHFSLPNPGNPSDPIDMANLGGAWGLNKAATPEQKAIFIDFMRFLSQPDVHKRAVEAQGMLPVVQGVELSDPVMNAWAQDAKFNVSKIQAISLDNELASKFLSYSQAFLTGGDLDGFVDKYASIYQEAAERLITQNKWDTTQW
ncbi:MULTISPECIES: ABC transporter substrate-binding protein [Cohnella]|uniref:ABC-type glycerol-3-phosphate transport system substrate-binding protein n=1 Tax=Cohnella phaseoli TaxID=456490 RepID=A0A3D9I5G4_9BACL|nr:extracellular solute-binding protein [Cohnella phaseoli]RED57033.1 ABC-type glycerol-3-phosphate transport system substrate-binding protein [Cohnella phaseoli]